MSLIIHAPNVHGGGGRTLLLSLLSSLRKPAVVQLDERFEPLPELATGVRVIRVAPRLIERLRAERRLQLLCSEGDILLCFGNLPPLFSNPARVFVYLQNRYLSSPRFMAGFPWSARLRIHVERLWLRLCLRGATLLVQTESMMQEVRDSLGRESLVLPFFPMDKNLQPPEPQSVLYDYLYVASGEPHKNHRRLVEAWIRLAEQDCFPTLCLTLDPQREAELLAWIEAQRSSHGLRISNSPMPSSQIGSLYAQSETLIYPSLFESLGLPLLEAHASGLQIIASERDYVRDVVTPLESFDPDSALSIARAVLRHRSLAHTVAMPMDATSFLEKLEGMI